MELLWPCSSYGALVQPALAALAHCMELLAVLIQPALALRCSGPTLRCIAGPVA